MIHERIRGASGDSSRSALGQASDWTTKGPDAFGDELTLGVVLSGGVIVITVY
jgi:hypothetical protein